MSPPHLPIKQLQRDISIQAILMQKDSQDQDNSNGYMQWQSNHFLKELHLYSNYYLAKMSLLQETMLYHNHTKQIYK